MKFWNKVVKGHPGECWLWAGRKNKSGYGEVKIAGKTHRAHRLAYELTKGPIPDGMWVLHRCDVRNCVYPGHLYLGTHQDNMDDMKLAKRGGQRGKRTTPAEPMRRR